MADEHSFEKYMIKKISEEFQLKARKHKEIIKGERFRKFIQRVIARKSYIQILERKNYPYFLIDILVNNDAKDSEFLGKLENMEKIKNLLAEKEIFSVISKNEEYGLYELTVTFRVNGMNVSCKVNNDLIDSAMYQNLYEIHKELESFKPPFQMISNGEKVKIENESKLLEYLYQKGKKGIVIQRYKGLGEMAPKQLWETTMDPEVRSLLKVSIQDAVEANNVFTILMGNEVEPRRNFIEKNALDAQNLDV